MIENFTGQSQEASKKKCSVNDHPEVNQEDLNKKCSEKNTIIWYNNSRTNQPGKYHKCKFCAKSLSSAIELNDHVNHCSQFLNQTIQGTKCKICGVDFSCH